MLVAVILTWMVAFMCTVGGVFNDYPGNIGNRVGLRMRQPYNASKNVYINEARTDARVDYLPTSVVAADGAETKSEHGHKAGFKTVFS